MNPVLVAVLIVVALILVVFGLIWVVRKAFNLLADFFLAARASRAHKQAEAKAYGWREFALDGPQDFDDEPCCCHPSYTRAACPLGFDDPDPVHGYPAEASAADAAKLRGDWERVGRDMERALELLGVHDDGKPVPPMRPHQPQDHHRVSRYRLDEPMQHTCSCGRAWPCADVVAKVWEGSE